MSRNIPIVLVDSLSQAASTMTRLLRVTLKTGFVYGLCMSNRDLVYDDGTGPITYSATLGFDPSSFSSDISYSVDNAEGYALLSNDIPELTVQMVEAGDFDDAQWICYYVDYEKLNPGTHIVLDAGDIGNVSTKGGLIWIPELLSYMMRLRQPVGGVWSRTCRAIFGTPADSQTGCGIDPATLWVAFTVSAIGAENNRTFSAAGLVPGSHGFYPGRVEWLTGDNFSKGGRIYATEIFDAPSASISLNETTPYPIKVGDQGRIRPDCDLTEAMCNSYSNYPNMKAEPRIPVGDTVAISVPGAQT
jgi:uncharacterized phage protein (TIGR02218 family)